MEQEKQYEEDFKEFIELLNKHGVEYMIVGAYAVMYHTNISRDTKDIDFWINKTKENAARCVQAIKEFNGLDVTATDLLGEKEIFFIGEEPYRIDILTKQGDFPFDKTYTGKEVGKFRDTKAFFISKNDLIVLKEHFYRDQDVKDLKRLYKAGLKAGQPVAVQTEERKHRHHRHR